MRASQYKQRELLGIILYPIFLAIVVAGLVVAGIIYEDLSHIYWTFASISVIAGILTFIVSYVVVFRRKRNS